MTPRPRLTIEASDDATGHAIAEGVAGALGLFGRHLRSRGQPYPGWLLEIQPCRFVVRNGPERSPLDSAPDAMLWSLKQTATALGVSDSTVRRLVVDEQLPTVRVCRRRLFRPADVQMYVDRLPTNSTA